MVIDSIFRLNEPLSIEAEIKFFLIIDGFSLLSDI
jgi:hypothetical protein